MHAHDAPATTTPAPTGPRLGLGPVGIAIRVIVAVAILVAGNLVYAGLTAAAFALLPAGEEESPLGLAAYVATQAGMLCAVLLGLWAWLRLVERRRLRDAGWRWSRGSTGWLLLGVLVSGGLVVAAVAVLPGTGPVAGVGSAPLWLSVVALLSQAFLLQAIPEELLFRGWLLSTWRDRPVLAVAVCTLSFTVIHLVSNGGQQSFAERLIYLAQPLGFALLATGLLLWTGSLWAAIGVHGGYHLGGAVAAALLPPVESVSFWIAVGAAHAAVGLVLVVTGLRRGRRLP